MSTQLVNNPGGGYQDKHDKQLKQSTAISGTEKSNKAQPITSKEKLKDVLKEQTNHLLQSALKREEAKQVVSSCDQELKELAERAQKREAELKKLDEDQAKSNQKLLLMTLAVFCKIIDLKPTQEDGQEIASKYLSCISFNKEKKCFELNMKTFVSYLTSHQDKVIDKENFFQFKKIDNVKDLLDYIATTKSCAIKTLYFDPSFQKDKEFQKTVKGFTAAKILYVDPNTEVKK